MNIYTNTIAYLYKWTELTTNRWYIGARSKRGCHPNDGYICSSRTVKPLVLENKDNWVREILCIGAPEYIVELETKLLTALDAKHDPLSYNRHNGDGKFTSLNRPCTFKGKNLPKHSAEACAKRRIAMLGKNVGKTPWNKGKTLTAEHIAKRQAARTDFTAWNKGKTGVQVAWNKGTKQTPEHTANVVRSRAENAAKKKAP